MVSSNEPLQVFHFMCVQTRPMHGYEITRAVERTTNGCCSPAEGTIYPVLREFEQGGYVTAHTEIVQGGTRGPRDHRSWTRRPSGGGEAWMEVAQCLVRNKCMTGTTASHLGRNVGKFFCPYTYTTIDALRHLGIRPRCAPFLSLAAHYGYAACRARRITRRLTHG